MSKKTDLLSKLAAEKDAIDAKARALIGKAIEAQDSGDFEGFMRLISKVQPLIQQGKVNTIKAFTVALNDKED